MGKANEKDATKGGGVSMNYLISTIRSIISKVVSYKISGITIKTPFIDFSFAPMKIMSSHRGDFFILIRN